MLVIAFDGILFDTLEFRATAVANALAAEGIATEKDAILSALPARSLAEVIRFVVPQHALDETTFDLAALRAERIISELGSRGAMLNVAVRDRLRRAAAVTRIVVRADSRRRDVEQLLSLAELDSVVSFVRCSDDTDNASVRSTDTANESIERSYAHIVRRLCSNRSLLGVASSIGVAVEAGEGARSVARTYGFDAPDNFSAVQLPNC